MDERPPIDFRPIGQADGLRDEREAEPHHSGSSSPEMDFLEMDFDPGPSCEQVQKNNESLESFEA